ncbi:MAG: SDR family NAD(P)-dependent oxidoreductase [Candidatus Micropelagos sp.]|uniref:SDR family NAD(P)-dependent oxidoreductase n=1 Tax=PS1 clade bacterium TaxID=2175152 RepID=A0A368ELE7_9PROT|nr:3-oxoacyl-ACP reductase [Hyphomicrobiales bacterium]OUV47576.1 MAG: 3-oxoacyl-ACP reductase [Alphaproteobacteria bacterium TMED110]RCL84704.1 MAG: SDR family NAD(P)-dependent oxidoreductase [PS1 clade bacterium]HCN32215.1 NAD(P)-dependent oxidoreductase [Rhodobiaceae bacterium]|tara:strand:+ start:766 stop:1518 length:753 start_codon:yes stop_codon:yes gene_type:complete
MASKYLLEGRRAIVTGGASGIGEAIVQAFVKEGAEVLIVDIPESKILNSYNENPSITPIEIDITDQNAPEVIISSAIKSMGGFDVLVNNAGISIPNTVEDDGDDIWERTMAVNVTSMFKISHAALPELKKSDTGRIINLGSIMSDMGGPGLFVYGTSKHAVAGMTKSMAVDLGQYGITVNYLQPGAVVTALSAPYFEDDDFRNYWIEKAPVGRLGQPEDVAHAAVFLAQKESQFISGLGLNVDGGAIVKF